MQNVVYFNSEMAICLRGIHGIGPSIAGTSTCRDARTNLSPFVVSAGGSHSSSEAAMVSAEQGGDGKPAFRYPFGSMLPWFKNKQGMTMKGVVNGAVLAEPTKDRLVGNRGNGEIARGIAQEELKEREGEEDVDGMELEDTTKRKGNWVFKILRVRSLWSEEGRKQEVNGEEMKDKEELGAQRVGRSSSSSESAGKDEQGDGADEYGFCEICQGDDDENKIVLDRDSFSKFLKRVPLEEAKLYAQLSYLGNLAYDIPNIKPENLLGRHGLHYLTSSIEKRQQMVSSGEKEEKITCSDIGVQRENEDQENSPTSVDGNEIKELKNDEGPIVSATSAFQIAASAASFLHSRTRSIFASSEDAGTGEDGVESVGSDERDKEEESESANSDMASFVATTDSVTAVVSAKEEVKQAVADDLNSISSAPCEWFICDDDKTSTRFFVIQGSETLASWQANLLFEPIEFEEVGVFVHRGIYEAAKGMYLQMLPEIHAHLKAHGKNAKFRFSGHSLGGSLSLLINLMLLIREEVPLSSLLPVVTFGSPCIMCGGDALLCKLGLPRSHIQAVTMHRDIVPRAFSCSYPSHVAELLKAISGNFRNHPCLNKQLKWLYSPMGELIILQPDPNFSPQHELLPSESGLYLLACSFSDAKDEAERQLRAAKNLFLNSPHPLEILSNRAAYGNGGTIQRDHDMRSYLKCVRNVLRQELIRIRKAQRKRKKLFWSIMTSYMLSGVGVIVDRVKVNLGAFNLLNLVRTGGESFKRFGRLVASHHIHLWVALLIPARLLLIRICSIFSVH